MITENLSTLKIHKLTQEQYDRAAAAGNLETDALYLTPAKIGGNINSAPMIVRPISETNVDITPAEIMAAQHEGRNVYFLFDEEVYFPLLIALNEFAVFSINSAGNTSEITVYEDSSFKITETSLEDRVNELINAGVETSFAPVVVTVDSDNNTNISADEIKAAYDSGRSVFLSLGSDYIPLYAAYKNTDANGDGNEAIFRFHVSGTMSADIVVRRNKMIVRDFPYALKLDIPTDDHINGLIEDKMGGEYELIETITLEEDTGTVIRTQEPNGKDLLLDYLVLDFAPPKDYIEDRKIYVNIGNTNATSIWSENDKIAYVNGTMINTNNRVTRIHVVKVKGKFINFCNLPNFYFASDIQGSMPREDTGHIKSIRIFAYNNTTDLLPTGTIIKIWGVRANA